MKMKPIHGTTDIHCETGTEGAVWIIMKDGYDSYEAMEVLEKGDHLCISDGDDVLFDGVINPDYEIGWEEYPLNKGFGQQAALGYWVHWIQKGWQPDDWAKLFIRKIPLKATLIKKKKKSS